MWEPGMYAATHNVYLSTSFDAVNDRAADALVAEGLPVETLSFDPGRLAFDTTYFWAVDEVNAAPDATVYPSRVWNFSIEAEALALNAAGATASSAWSATWK